ncbi:MAG: zinc ribbon domain-containing protein [Microbacteriaceae bacterium]|nr:zinc ribbon domain-containing protein [Microbacteriaceae bacterium]
MMECAYCATILPPDALFCGECGRAASSTSARAVREVSRPLTASVPQPEPWMNSSADGVCEQCGRPVSTDDIFCGECGFVVRHAMPPVPRPNDTTVIERRERVTADGPEPEPESGISEGSEDFAEDVESTRIVSAAHLGERFVLQFSTGESFTVYGSGLIGRSPRAEPGEYFDQLVRITDASRSVSKTHLEFGQEAGSFWVKDRFSGNGTIIREPESKPVRCHPERRYRLVRGSRVDLGEQFFIVS